MQAAEFGSVSLPASPCGLPRLKSPLISASLKGKDGTKKKKKKKNMVAGLVVPFAFLGEPLPCQRDTYKKRENILSSHHID